jgi:hypothetical protein
MTTPNDAMESMKQNLAERTGKTLADWAAVVRTANLAKHGQIVVWLKSEHGMGHGYANLVAHEALNPCKMDAPAGLAELNVQYAGAKAALKPIYEAIIRRVESFGSDVEVSPKKSYVSLRRKKQFALIQPSTATRVDVGINLKGISANARLEAAGSFNAMVTHRVRVTNIKAIDAELVSWLKAAYTDAG